MKKPKHKLILSVVIVLSLFTILIGNVWALQVAQPHALFEGFMQTYLDNGLNDDLIFADSIITGVILSDGSMPADDPIIGQTITISGSKRTPSGIPGTTFTNATFRIGDQSSPYFFAALSDINFSSDGVQWFLNPGLDSNDPQTLNLSNILLNPNGSAYILDLAAALGSNTNSGMQMTLDVFDGDITGDSNSFVQGLIAAPVPEPSTIILLSAGILGLAGLRRKRSKQK